jgi:hypothetical protein
MSMKWMGCHNPKQHYQREKPGKRTSVTVTDVTDVTDVRPSNIRLLLHLITHTHNRGYKNTLYMYEVDLI